MLLARRTLPLLALAALVACDDDAGPSAAATSATAPEVIELPAGFQPEGITAQGNQIFVGSIPTGAVYRADVTTGTGAVFVSAQPDRAAIGMKVDDRGRLFVAGGPKGMAYVYDANTGQNLAEYVLTDAQDRFVNDVALASDAAWFTDSRNPVLYRVPLAVDGSLAPQTAVTNLPLSGDFQQVPGVINLNGIAFTGHWLLVVQSNTSADQNANTGHLFRVHPETGVTQRIDLGAESVVGGDGLWLEAQTLYVVQNRLNQIAVVDLAPDFGSGTVRTRLTHPAFDVPTTLTAAGTHLYAVNARFGTPPSPTTTYSVVRLDRPTPPVASRPPGQTPVK